MASLAPAPGPGGNVRAFAQPRSGRPKLRVGVFADHRLQPRWLVDALARVAASDFAELSLVAVRGDAPSSLRTAARRGTATVWRAIDRGLFGTGRDGSEDADLALLVAPERRVEGSGVERIGEARLDVAVALGEVSDAALDGLARFGTWRYCFGEDLDPREALAGVREVVDADAVAAIGLRIRRAGVAIDRIACTSWSRVVPFSLARTREGMMPKAADFLARALRDLQAAGAAWFEHATTPALRIAHPHGVAHPDDAALPQGVARPPSLVALRREPALKDIARVASRAARRALERQLSLDQWQLAFRFGADQPWDGSLEGFTRLVPPKDRFWADPFPVQAQGRHFVFFEELPFAAGKAHISVVEIDAAGRSSEPRRALERDYHLSYPFLVEDEGCLYMIPESAHNRTVEIHRCVEFPHRWKLEKVLIRDAWCADATVHRGADGWWMFATRGEEGGEVNDELHVFHADRLLGEWRPHRRNPVRSDVRGARPAGRLFMADGRLHRPGQVCAPIYGAGIALHEVTRLDDGGYAEREVRRIVPAGAGGVLGMHTVNRAGALTVTDLFVRRPRFGP